MLPSGRAPAASRVSAGWCVDQDHRRRSGRSCAPRSRSCRGWPDLASYPELSQRPRPRLKPTVFRLAPNLGNRRVVEDIEEPVGGDPGPALGALQLVEVSQAPEQGRYLAAELDAQDVVDGELAP